MSDNINKAEHSQMGTWRLDMMYAVLFSVELHQLRGMDVTEACDILSDVVSCVNGQG